jgi:hypothetical protein
LNAYVEAHDISMKIRNDLAQGMKEEKKEIEEENKEDN